MSRVVAREVVRLKGDSEEKFQMSKLEELVMR